MTRLSWWLVDTLSGGLEPDERDAVRGDFTERGITGGRALRDLLGLLARRQIALLHDWRVCLALLAFGIPLGVLLSLTSRQLARGSAVYTWQYVNNWTWTILETPGPRRDLVHYSTTFLVRFVTLACWSWSTGLLLQTILVLMPSLLGIRHGRRLSALPSWLRTTVRVSAFVVVATLAMARWAAADVSQRAASDYTQCVARTAMARPAASRLPRHGRSV